MLVLLLYIPVAILAFFAGLSLMLLGAVFSGILKFLVYLLAVLTLVVMCVVAVVSFTGGHILGLLACFFLFAWLGSAVSHRR